MLGRLESNLETARTTVQSIQASANELNGKVDSPRQEFTRILQDRIDESGRRIRAAVQQRPKQSGAT